MYTGYIHTVCTIVRIVDIYNCICVHMYVNACMGIHTVCTQCDMVHNVVI